VTQRIARKPREKIKPSEPCGLKTAYVRDRSLLITATQPFGEWPRCSPARPAAIGCPRRVPPVRRKITRASQQQLIVQRLLQVAVRALDRAVLMRKAGVGARRRHPVMRAKRLFDVPPGIPGGGGIRAGIPGEGGGPIVQGGGVPMSQSCVTRLVYARLGNLLTRYVRVRVPMVCFGPV
jgi:hypothetical protein